jgi:hypothetical protein
VWTDVGVAAGLLALGAAALALRGRVRYRPLGSVVALVLAATGLLVLARSFRTLWDRRPSYEPCSRFASSSIRSSRV